MNRTFLQIFTLALILCALPLAARAVEVPPDPCKVQAELIFEMTKPAYGAYSVWDAFYGDMNSDEQFVSGVALENGNTVVAGQQKLFGKPDTILVLEELESRGRKVWDVKHTVAGLSSVKKILKTKEGFAVMGAAKDKSGRSGIWLGFFDGAGKLLSQKTISGGKFSLLPEDMITQIDGSGFVLAASSGDEKKELYNAAIYHLDAKGAVTADHSYMPGLDNRLYGLSIADKDSYIATGTLRGDDGRLTGWILMLNKDGSLDWQRQYPRGSLAVINRAIPMTKDFILAAGDVKPAGEGRMAGWVMAIDTIGNVAWQRYYTGELHQSARDVLVNMDGVATVMMQNTKPGNTDPSSDVKDYVRLVTVTPRGELAVSDEYFNAEGARASQMIGGRTGERILIGGTNMAYRIEATKEGEEDKMRYGWDGWVLAAAPMAAIPDPCQISAPQ